MKNALWSLPPRLAAWGCLVAALSACTNFGPVRTFGGESKKLGAAFAVMPDAAVDICRADAMLMEQTLPAGDRFDLSKARGKTEQVCAPLASRSDAILPLARLLEQYGDTLAALADEKLPDYSVDLKTLEKSLNGLKDGDKPVLEAHQTGAIMSLGRLLGRLVTERAARNEIRALLEQQEGVQATTAALRWYVNRAYKSQLNKYDQVLDGTLRGMLPQFERNEPLAARAMMVSLQQERDRLVVLSKSADSFIAAADKLEQSRAEVLAKLDRPDDKEMLRQLRELAEEVRTLRKQLRAE